MIRRQIIGAGFILGIIGGIGIDWYIHASSEHIAYAREPDPPRVIQIRTVVNWTPERIEQEIETAAEKYGRNAEYLRSLIKCESNGSTTIQSNHRYTFTDKRRGIHAGEREESYGLAQIHLPDHPSVSREQAIDPAFAIDFMAKNLGKVKWYCEDLI